MLNEFVYLEIPCNKVRRNSAFWRAIGYLAEFGENDIGQMTDFKQVKQFVYLGGNISENGRVEVDVRCRIQSGANAWRNIEGVMMDRKISEN